MCDFKETPFSSVKSRIIGVIAGCPPNTSMPSGRTALTRARIESRIAIASVVAKYFSCLYGGGSGTLADKNTETLIASSSTTSLILQLGGCALVAYVDQANPSV